MDEKSSKNGSEEPNAANVPSLLSLLRFATPLELGFNALGIICAAGVGAAQPLMTLLLGNLTSAFVKYGTASESDAAASGEFMSTASHNALLLFILGLAQGLATWLFMYIWSYTAETSAKRLREQYLRSVLRQPMHFFDEVGAGEVATRIQTDTHLFQRAISEKVAFVVQYTSAFIAAFAIAYVRSWKLALAMTAILPVTMATGIAMGHFESHWMQRSRTYVAESGSLAQEVISTIRTTHAFGTQKVFTRLFDSFVSSSMRVERKAAMLLGLGTAIFFFVIYATFALGFYFGTTLVLAGEINVGVLLNVLFSVLVGTFSLALLPAELQAIAHGRAAAGKLFFTIDKPSSIDPFLPSGRIPKSINGTITLDAVSFHYPSRPSIPVINNLNLVFEPHQTTAVVGPSGSGKSTIISLLERFYDPVGGSIKLDGVDLRELNARWLRSQIGLVSQEPSLFSATVWQNVAQGLIGSAHEDADDSMKDALIRAACAKANAHEFIMMLPDGYVTEVGERAFSLSGGQKQRIAIARAIVSNPPILLLDEATSALDTRSEAVVQDALDKAASGRTTIVIAHRLSTIKKANQIYVLEGGLVLEHGTHSKLMANSEGPYAKLVAAQTLRDSEHQNKAEPSAMEASSPLSEPPAEKGSNPSNPDEALNTVSGYRYSTLELCRRVLSANSRVWRAYSLATLGAIGAGCVYPAFGIVIANTVSSFQLELTKPEQRSLLRVAGDRSALWFFLIALTSSVAVYLQTYYFNVTAASLVAQLRNMTFQALLKQDVSFFDDNRHSTGALTSELSDNPEKLKGIAGSTLGAIIQSLACVVSGMLIGLAFGPKLALVAIATIPFVLSSGYVRLRVVMLKDEMDKAAHNDSAQMACEAVALIRTVASLTAEESCCNRYADILREPLRRAVWNGTVNSGLYALSTSFSYWGIALVFWYGAKLVASGEYNTSQLFICLISITFGATQAGNVFTWVPDVSSAHGAAQRVFTLLDMRPLVDVDSSDGKIPTDVVGEIKMQSVQFRYPSRPSAPVLQGLTLNIQPGSFVALIGPSGCGKSTVIQLLVRFYDPASGSILLDGNPIEHLNLQAYRKSIALVSQEPTLFAGTIRFNILLGIARSATDIELEEVCKQANILDFIQSLPEGFDTPVGRGGTQLSGGQKQRIAIARALVRNPRILLLDEATSALDSHSESIVQDALDKAAKGRTTIAVAHRLSSIQNADMICFIRDGAIIEQGTHNQLVSQRGAYYEYTQLQQLSGAEK